MKVEMKMAGLDGVLDALRALPPEIVAKRGGPVRAALRKAAVVIHKEELARLQVALANADDEGKRLSTGLLMKNVIVTRGKKPIGSEGERYLVRVRRKSYKRNGAKVTTHQTANLLEYGSSKQKPEPWIRPAFAMKAPAAIQTAQDELVKSINRIAKKLFSKRKGK